MLEKISSTHNFEWRETIDPKGKNLRVEIQWINKQTK